MKPNNSEKYSVKIKPEENLRAPLIRSWRFCIAIQIGMGISIFVAFRYLMGMTLVCMMKENRSLKSPLNHSSNDYVAIMRNASNDKNSALYNARLNYVESDYETTSDYNYTKSFQGHLLSSYFYGLAFGFLFGGILNQKYSAKKVLIYSILFCSLSCAVVPHLAPYSKWFLVAVRVIQGIASGVGLPARTKIITAWSTPEDVDALLCITYFGYAFGALFSLHFPSILCPYGWDTLFYLLCAVGVAYAILIFFLLTDDPHDHKYVTKLELRYLQTRYTNKQDSSDIEKDPRSESLIHRTLSKHTIKSIELESETSLIAANEDLQIRIIPCNEMKEMANRKISHGASHRTGIPKLSWRHALTYPPSFVGIFSYLLFSYGWQTFGIHQPLFMKDIFHFPLEENALASSIPWLFIMPTLVLIPMILKLLLKKFSLTTSRKIITVTGGLLAAVVPSLIIELSWMDRWLSSCILSLAEVGNTLAYSGGFAYTFVDMAPDYVALYEGIQLFFLALSGLVAPNIVAYLTPHGTLEEWRVVFLISSGIYVVSVVVYLVFGSSDKKKFDERHKQFTCKYETKSEEMDVI